MKTLYTVYRATNSINGKQYVGVDTDWPTARMMHEGARGDTEHFHREIRKYGPQLFRWEAVLQTENAKEANKLAIELGTKTMAPNGFNTEIKLAPETPNQISRTAKPLEAGLNGTTAADVMLTAPSKNSGGPVYSPEPMKKAVAKGKITEAGRKKISEAVSRPVTIEGIVYRSIKEASEQLGLHRHQVKMILKGTNSVSYYREKNAQTQAGK